MYHGFARASGLNYWQGMAYSLGGGALWEIAGETTQPSSNDLVTTSIDGTFVGEALFRMSNLWLERTTSPLWRELGAAVISPPVGLNRLAFGDRFRGIYPSGRPLYYGRLHLGASAAALEGPGPDRDVERYGAVVSLALDYGLPADRGYHYKRPFDYFSFEATAATDTRLESLMTHGLLFGADYGGSG